MVRFGGSIEPVSCHAWTLGALKNVALPCSFASSILFHGLRATSTWAELPGAFRKSNLQGVLLFSARFQGPLGAFFLPCLDFGSFQNRCRTFQIRSWSPFLRAPSCLNTGRATWHPQKLKSAGCAVVLGSLSGTPRSLFLAMPGPPEPSKTLPYPTDSPPEPFLKPFQACSLLSLAPWSSQESCSILQLRPLGTFKNSNLYGVL